MITHFQWKETKGKDYFRKAWSISFIMKGQSICGVYHQDGNIEWDGSNFFPMADEEEVKKELHRLMSFHVFR